MSSTASASGFLSHRGLGNNSNMRGLVQFIADLRNARARELEEKRINKELANIRQKFKGMRRLPVPPCWFQGLGLTVACRWEPQRIPQEEIRLQGGFCVLCDLGVV